MIPGVKLIDDILRGLPENARLRSELAELRVELTKQAAAFETEIQQRDAALADARAEIARLKPADDLDPKALEILKFYFDESDDIAAEYIAGRFGLTVGVAEYHIDALREREFISLVGVAPAIHAINSNGRKYVMQHKVA